MKLLSKDYIIENMFSNNSYFIYFLINNKKIIYIGTSIYSGIDANIRYVIRKHNIKYDSYFTLKCDINDVYNSQTMYILKFSPKYNLKLPKKNNLYISKYGIHRRWINKYGNNYKSVIDVNSITFLNSIVVGSVMYYEIKDLNHIESKLKLGCLKLDRAVKKHIYVGYYIYCRSINEIAGDLYLNVEDVEDVINELQNAATHSNKEKDKILKMYFCEGYKIKDINKNDKLSESHIIKTIVDYLSLFGI